MGCFELEPLKTQYEEIQEAVSSADREDGKIGNAVKAVWEKEKNSMKFIPENDIKIYTISRHKENVSMLG